MDYLCKPNIITRVLIIRRQENQRETKKERDVKAEAEVIEERRCYTAGFEDGGRGRKLRNVDSLWRPAKARKCIFPLSFQKACRFAGTNFIPVEQFWISDLQNGMIINVVGFKPICL